MATQNSPRNDRGREPISPELREEILQKVAEGHRVVELAQQHGISPYTIYGWKRKKRLQVKQEATPEKSTTPNADSPKTPAPITPPTESATGRYSQAFKDEVVRQVLAGRKGVAVSKQYAIPVTTVYRWVAAAKVSADNTVPPAASTRPPGSGRSPIDDEHRELVLEIKNKHVNMGPAQIQNQLKRFHGIKLGRQLIGRILVEAGFQLEKRSKHSTASPADNRFEMSRPNELWAVDFKELWIQSEKVYALFAIDDFSRFCVGFALTQQPTAELAIQTVEEAIQRHGRPERILSDRGPQFHAWNGISQFDEYLADYLADHTVTKARHSFTNGKVEAFNKTVETELFLVEEFPSIPAAKQGLTRYITHYNFQRTHMALDGLVPADRYFGMVEEAQQALLRGLEKAGSKLTWFGQLTDQEGARSLSTILQLLVEDGKLALVVLGRRLLLG